MILVFNITVIQVYAPAIDAEEAETGQFYEDLWHFLELTPKKKKKKDAPFIIWHWNAKVGSQEITRITGMFGLGVQNEAGQWLTVLWKEHAAHSKHTFPTTQEMILHMDIIRWPTPKSGRLCSLYVKMEKLYTISKNKTWSLFRSSTPYCKIQT